MKNFAVIGIGRMGSIHANNLACGRVMGAKLVAVCDLDTDKTAAFARKHGAVKTYADYKEMLGAEKPDAVIVATPHYSHITIVKYCLNHGVNVLSEKPQSVTIGEAAEGIAESDKHPEVKYGIMYNQRTNRMYSYAKRLMDDGALGELKRVSLTVTDWYRSQFYYNMGEWRASWNGEGGGILINQCVHQLDILQWLTGMPTKITAFLSTVNRNITVENDVTAVFEYANGARGTFVALGHELVGTNRFEIAGDKGKIVMNKYRMTYYSFDKSEHEVNATVTKGYGSTSYKVKKVGYGIMRLARDGIFGQQMRIVQNFADVLNGDTDKLIAEGKEGINALTIINGIYLSGYTGETVEVPFDAKRYDELLETLKKGEKTE